VRRVPDPASAADVTTFDVFDCHHHVGDVREFLSGDIAGVAPGIDEERRRRIAIMDAGGVSQAAVIVGHGYPRPRGLEDTRAVNDAIAAYRDADPRRFPVAIGVVEPLYMDAGLAEVVRCRDELRLAGLSFHARFQGVSMDNPWIRRYIDRMAQVGLVPLLHAMTESSDEALWKVGLIAGSFPDVAMLVLDAFSTFEGTKEATTVADRHPNLLFDTSLAYNADFIELFADRFGADRVVFGTDLYSPPVGRRISHVLAQLLESDLSDADKALIVGGNARRLFGLSAAAGGAVPVS